MFFFDEEMIENNSSNRTAKKQAVIERLRAFFERYFGIGGGEM